MVGFPADEPNNNPAQYHKKNARLLRAPEYCRGIEKGEFVILLLLRRLLLRSGRLPLLCQFLIPPRAFEVQFLR